MHIINMIEPLIRGLDAVMPELDDLLAEAAPEGALAVVADVARVLPLLKVLSRGDVVAVPQVLFELMFAEADYGAGAAGEALSWGDGVGIGGVDDDDVHGVVIFDVVVAAAATAGMYCGVLSVGSVLWLLLLRCRGHGLVASPTLDLEMLRVFMALPIVLTSELLMTARMGAAVRAGMTLFMFPMDCFVRNECPIQLIIRIVR